MKTYLLTLFARLYIATFRYRVHGLDVVEKIMKDNKRAVFSLWHNQLLCIVGRHYGFDVVTMISRSQDGGYFTSLVQKVGYKVVRASSSRGASVGTHEVVNEMNKGQHAAMAADGPKGPKYKIKSGGIYLAKKTDGIIVPVLADCTSFFRFNSWDNFILPKPFARVDVTFCEPIYVSPSVEKEDIAKELAEEQEKIMELTRVYSKNII